MNSNDCDDHFGSELINPNGLESCNGLDDNCNGQTDEGVKIIFYEDADGDGFGDAFNTIMACLPVPGYVLNNSDCNDSPGAATINPNAAESCNGVDDNCNSQVDEGVKFTFYADTDGDGYGDIASSIMACSAPPGYVENNTDCNDNTGAGLIHPSATEVCNGLDDNCNSQTDEGVQFIFYADADGDGFGNAANSTQACAAPSGYVSNSTDCNDNIGAGAINPDATEICNGVDDNCNSQTDEGVKFIFYADADGDGFGNAANSAQACAAPSGYVSNSTDCNDNIGAGAINPVATEICNGIDDNCNNQTDEGVKSTFYADTDHDSYGNNSITTLACAAPVGYTSTGNDCNDGNAAVHPNVPDVCNSIDDNCNNVTDENAISAYDFTVRHSEYLQWHTGYPVSKYRSGNFVPMEKRK
jgi:hypothetical protein